MVENPPEINGACSAALIRRRKAPILGGMARPARALTALLMLAAVAASAEEPAGADEAAIRRMNGDYVRAFLASDVPAFRAMLAEDFTGVLASGLVVDKAEFLRLAAERPDAHDLRLSGVTIRLFGESALVGAAVSYRRADGSAVRTRYTCVFARREGRWEIEWVQWTRVVAP
jgi:ketosteroid isomerase-like protein